MSFHNPKEEVIEIHLTQFGRNCLARGVFKPVYYQFFDDGILYNSQNANFTEEQNSTENRILENTPKLKSQYINNSIQRQYFLEDERIASGSSPRFKKLKRNFNPDHQDSLLFYPLGEQEVSVSKYAKYSAISLGSAFATGSVQYITGSNLNKRVPQISTTPEYKIELNKKMNYNNSMQSTSEEFKDLMSNIILFNDNSSIHVMNDDFILDLQELNTSYGLENFELEVFEILENDEGQNLKRINKLEEINKFFKIKTDDDVDVQSQNIKNIKQTNYRKREET